MAVMAKHMTNNMMVMMDMLRSSTSAKLPGRAPRQWAIFTAIGPTGTMVANTVPTTAPMAVHMGSTMVNVWTLTPPPNAVSM